MKNKLILLISIFFVFSSCGYSPIYSSKNSDFHIVKVEISEKNKINSQIKNNLIRISNKESINKYKLVINSIKQKKITSKDNKGNADILNMMINVNLKVYEKDLLISNNSFSESFSYANNSNKFDLSKYEKNIENNLINKIISDVNSHIFSLQK